MRTLIPTFCIFLFGLAMAQNTEQMTPPPEPDPCHKLFNLSEIELTVEELCSFNELSFSEDYCEAEGQEIVEVESCNVVFHYKDKPAELIVAKKSLQHEVIQSRFKSLVPGDRVYLEGAIYAKDGQSFELKPVIFIIQ